MIFLIKGSFLAFYFLKKMIPQSDSYSSSSLAKSNGGKEWLWRACYLTAFTDSSTGPVVHPFASLHEGPGFNPQGVLIWNRDSPVSIVPLHWWPGHDWSLWPCLRRALSQTVTRPPCQQSDNPTWSHTALLSCFHARCRSSFRLHNRHSRLLGGSPVESLQSHCIHTQFHWSSGPPVCFLSWGIRVQSSGGFLCETGILLLALSHYTVIHYFRYLYK